MTDVFLLEIPEYFAKNIERIYKFKETGDSRCIYQNDLDKACFKCDRAYGST